MQEKTQLTEMSVHVIDAVGWKVEATENADNRSNVDGVHFGEGRQHDGRRGRRRHGEP